MDRAERRTLIASAVDALGLCDGRIAELRALGVSTPSRKFEHVQAGYFDDASALVEAALDVEAYASGVYVTPNAPNPALMARTANRLAEVKRRQPVTGDHDIDRRRWILVDLDPVRPAGISASNSEVKKAKKVCNRIIEALNGKGFPEPLVAFSGNGYHILYACDLPNNEDSQLVIQDWLVWLGSEFSTKNVTVDKTVFNASRIWKLYGTTARKGENVSDRPWRISRLLHKPKKKQKLVKLKTLKKCSASKPVRNERKARPKAKKTISGFDVQAWINECIPNSLDVSESKPWKGGGLKWVLECCPEQPELHRGGCAFIAQQPNGAVVAGCRHNSCRWGWKELRAKYGIGSPKKEEPLPPPAALKKAQKPKPKPKQEITSVSHNALAELFEIDLAGESGVLPVYAQGRLWGYVPEQGIWGEVTNADVYAVIADRDGEMWLDEEKDEYKKFQCFVPLARNITESIRLRCSDEKYFDGVQFRGGLQFGNGYLQVTHKGFELLPSGPNLRQRVRIRKDWDPKAKCKRWRKALKEWFGDDENGRIVSELFQEFYGACLFNLATKFQKILFCVGEGDNGKSVALQILKDILPSELTTAADPEVWSSKSKNPEYYLAYLDGVRLNVCADIAANTIHKSNTLKKIIAGDPVTARRPAGRPFDLIPQAGHIFSANKLPRSYDNTFGWWRRVLVIPFDRKIEKRDLDLTKQLMGESSGILAWAVEGAVRLLDRGKFIESTGMLEAVDKWKVSSNPVLAWFEDQCKLTPAAIDTPAKKLYAEFIIWCENNGYKRGERINTSEFSNSLVTQCGVERRRLREGVRYGCALREPWEILEGYKPDVLDS